VLALRSLMPRPLIDPDKVLAFADQYTREHSRWAAAPSESVELRAIVVGLCTAIDQLLGPLFIEPVIPPAEDA
jgi:hypothetical protein